MLNDINNSDGVILYCTNTGDKTEAEKLAKLLKLRLVFDLPKECDLMLIMDSDGLSLSKDGLKIRGDFSKLTNRIKKQNLQSEFLIKASKIKGRNPEELTAVDATAGLGEDSFILAANGLNVILYEKDSIIFALLDDALKRAKKIPELSHIASRMTAIYGDSIKELEKSEKTPDIILLDPMFPERQKSALVKKKFQLIHNLEKPCNNEKELLKVCLKANPLKLLIKRPVKGAYLAGVKPDYSISGKAVRYDCFTGKQK